MWARELREGNENLKAIHRAILRAMMWVRLPRKKKRDIRKRDAGATFRLRLGRRKQEMKEEWSVGHHNTY